MTKEELEKENAELNNFIMQSKEDGISPINALIIKNLCNQLTKAKELLRDVLPYIDLTDCVNSDPRLVLYDKIKSLIKEIEK